MTAITDNRKKRGRKLAATINTTPLPATDTDRALNMAEILRALGCARATFYRWQQTVPDFPPTFKHGGGAGKERVKIMLSDLTAFQRRHVGAFFLGRLPVVGFSERIFGRIKHHFDRLLGLLRLDDLVR